MLQPTNRRVHAPSNVSRTSSSMQQRAVFNSKQHAGREPKQKQTAHRVSRVTAGDWWSLRPSTHMTHTPLSAMSLLLHAVMDAPFSRRAWQGRKAAWDFTAREVQSPHLLTKEPADQPLLSTFFLNRNRCYCYLQKKYVLEWFSIRICTS